MKSMNESFQADNHCHIKAIPHLSWFLDFNPDVHFTRSLFRQLMALVVVA